MARTLKQSIATGMLAAACMLSGVASDGAPPGPPSIPQCVIVSISNPDILESALADAVTTTANILCVVGPADGKAIQLAANAAANAYAYAVAEAAAGCPETSPGVVGLTPPQRVVTAADEWLLEYIERVGQELTCEPCGSFASSWESVMQTVFLNTLVEEFPPEPLAEDAIAKVERVFQFKQDLEAAVSEAYFNPLIAARDVFFDSGCASFESSKCFLPIPGSRKLLQFDNPEGCTICVISGMPPLPISQIGSFIDAVNTAREVTCSEVVIQSASITLGKQLTTTAAQALAIGGCSAPGGFACLEDDFVFQGVANELAQQFVRFWASSTGQGTDLPCADKCSIDVDAGQQVISEIFFEALSAGYGSICTEGGTWTVEALSASIPPETQQALGGTALSAIMSVPPETCISALNSGALAPA